MAEAPKKGRLTLYENLLSPEAIAEMQARDAKEQAAEAKKKKDASLMFKPTNLGKKNNKPATKPKPTFASAHKLSSSTSTAAAPSDSSPGTASEQLSSTPQGQLQSTQKRSYNDWLAKEDDQEFYDRPRYPPPQKKKKKKKEQEKWSFDDPYDPSVPVPFQSYPGSEDWHELNVAWRERLKKARERHFKRWERQGKDEPYGSGSYEEPGSGLLRNNQFAPPPSFAPPADYSSDPVSRSGSYEPSSGRNSGFGYRQDNGRPSFAPPNLDKDESGDDAFARRLAMSGQQPPGPSPANIPPMPISAVPPPPVEKPVPDDILEKRAKAQAQIAAIKARAAAAKSASPGASAQNPAFAPPASASPPVEVPPPPPAEPPAPSGVISAAPTFNPEYYAQKAQQQAAEDAKSPEDTIPDTEAPRSKAPGQAGAAQRMMQKMGWEEGKGLGASGEGIANALTVKAEKRKKKSDAAGGGYVTPANMGKIQGPKQKKSDADEDPNSKMSLVVKFEGMLQGMDVDKAIQDEGLYDEIGEEMKEFGVVERLKIWREHEGGNDEVFIKFTSPLSALNAIKNMDGAEFADNKIKASFWDDEKFEAGVYA